MTNLYVGIDVCKDFLDVYVHPLGEYKRFPNTKQGYKAIGRWLRPHKIAQVVLEATGKLHRAICRYLSTNGYNIAIVNPYRSRKFADSMGVLAKTDKVDAKILALFGERMRPDNAVVPTETEEKLKDLLTARGQIVSQRTVVKQILKDHTQKTPLSMFEKQKTLLEKQLKSLDEEILQIIASDEELSRRYDILISIKGIGAVGAMVMVVYLQELGQLSEKEIAALVGVVPFNQDSGNMRGKRMIKGGRKHVRTQLYMPALSASKHNPDMKKYYDRMMEKGKPVKLALTAIIRKLVVLANALIKQNRKWMENYA